MGNPGGRTVIDRLRGLLERSRPVWLIYLAFVLWASLPVLAERYPRLKAILARVNEWISSS